MDAIYYLSGTLMTITFIGLVVATIFFLAKPHILQKSKRINKPVSRQAIVLVALASLLVTIFFYGSVMAATEPASVKQARMAEEAAKLKAQQVQDQAAEAQRQAEEEAKKPVVKTETKTEVIPFESITQDDNTLAKGETRIATEGIDGERTITYEVTYVQGQETTRKEIKNEVTKPSITKVTQTGTYVAPVYTPTPTPAPAPQTGVRVGATCNDGSHSSATGSGACSHHGGVAYWLYG